MPASPRRGVALVALFLTAVTVIGGVNAQAADEPGLDVTAELLVPEPETNSAATPSTTPAVASLLLPSTTATTTSATTAATAPPETTTTTTAPPETTTTTTAPPPETTTTTTAPPPETTTTTTAPPPPENSVQAAIQRWFPEQVQRASDIAWCESRHDPNAVSPGGGNHGLFQINTVHRESFQQVTGVAFDDGVYDADLNTRFARWLYDREGWSPWGCA